MTQTTHTPGPWAITDDFIGVHDEQGRCIADMDSEGAPDIGYGESLANAHLIAAAPDLLAALSNIILSSDANCGDSLANAIEAARVAITKAKGQ